MPVLRGRCRLDSLYSSSWAGTCLVSLVDDSQCDIVEILERISKKHDTFAFLLAEPLNSYVVVTESPAKETEGLGETGRSQ